MNVSLYCSPTHLKLVIGSADSNVIRVEDYGIYLLPEGAMINGIITDEEAMIRYLAEIGEVLDCFKHEALLVIDTSNIRSRVIDVPIVPELKMIDFIAHDLGAFSEGGNNDVFDYAVLNGKTPDGGARVLAVAVDREILQVYRNTFTSAGFNLKGVNIGINALVKLSRILPQLKTGARILAAIDDRNLTLSLFEDGDYKITNRYRLLQMEDTQEWRQELGNNISAVIQFHKGQRPTEEISAVYFAGLSPTKTAALAEPLAYLGIEIGLLNVAAHVRLTGKAAKIDGGFAPGQNLLNLGTMLKK